MQLKFIVFVCSPHIVRFAGGTPGTPRGQLCGTHSDPSLHSQVFWQNWMALCVFAMGAGHLLSAPIAWHFEPAAFMLVST
jgi:hypothetical protein